MLFDDILWALDLQLHLLLCEHEKEYPDEIIIHVGEAKKCLVNKYDVTILSLLTKCQS